MTKTTKELFKREYLRGIIDGQRIKLPEKYGYELDQIYEDYLKVNEETVEEFKKYD